MLWLKVKHCKYHHDLYGTRYASLTVLILRRNCQSVKALSGGFLRYIIAQNNTRIGIRDQDRIIKLGIIVVPENVLVSFFDSGIQQRSILIVLYYSYILAVSFALDESTLAQDFPIAGNLLLADC